jgi:hypothetical protein
LRLTNTAASQASYAIFTPTLPSAHGLQAAFTESMYQNGCRADGLAFAIFNGSQALPSSYGKTGGNLGYVGLANAYLGIGLDEYGNFSSVVSGPGKVSESVAVHGSSASGWAYIAGYQSGGAYSSLPFRLDYDTATLSRSSMPLRRVRVTLTPQLMLKVEINVGSGYVAYIPWTNIANVNGSTPPSSYRIGFTAATGGCAPMSIHEIQDLTVTSSP